MAPKSVDAYIRTQGISAAVINMALNPLLAWLVNPGMEYMTLTGDRSIVIDAAVTSVVLSLLVSLCATAAVRRYAKTGDMEFAGGSSVEGRLLSRLPRRAWALGLVLGSGVALVLVVLIVALFRLRGVQGLTFARYAIFKAAYTGLLGYVVTRWVLIRQLPLAARHLTGNIV